MGASLVLMTLGCEHEDCRLLPGGRSLCSQTIITLHARVDGGLWISAVNGNKGLYERGIYHYVQDGIWTKTVFVHGEDVREPPREQVHIPSNAEEVTDHVVRVCREFCLVPRLELLEMLSPDATRRSELLLEVMAS